MELSIDTSTRYASVGLSVRGEALAHLGWRSGRNHSVELIPAIRRLTGHLGVEMARLEAVFVARGPGGFSALRVGMSTAKALAAALDVPLVAVGTLDVEAHPYLRLGAPVCALIEAGKRRLYVGKYDGVSGLASPGYEVVSPEDFVASAETSTLFCGEGVSSVADRLRERLGEAARIVDAPPPTRVPNVLARLAHMRWRDGDTDDPATLQPLYLRSAQVDTARRAWSPDPT